MAVLSAAGTVGIEFNTAKSKAGRLSSATFGSKPRTYLLKVLLRYTKKAPVWLEPF